MPRITKNLPSNTVAIEDESWSYLTLDSLRGPYFPDEATLLGAGANDDLTKKFSILKVREKAAYIVLIDSDGGKTLNDVRVDLNLCCLAGSAKRWTLHDRIWHLVTPWVVRIKYWKHKRFRNDGSNGDSGGQIRATSTATATRMSSGRHDGVS